MRQKIGIFAGSFDPIHDGHLAFASAALEQINLDRVVLLPEPQPRRKSNVSPIAKRVDAIEQALQNIKGLEVISINQPQFTVEHTMPTLIDLYPNSDFWLLIGSDIVHHLHYWPKFESMRKTVPIIVGLRQGFNTAELRNYLDTLGVKYQIIETAYGHIASSQLR